MEQLHEASVALGPATVQQLCHEIFPRKHWGVMAESETFAHLEHMVLQGEAERWREGEGQLLLPRRRRADTRYCRPHGNERPRTRPQRSPIFQQLIRNACVNDGHVESGGEIRSVDLLEQYLGTHRSRRRALRAACPGARAWSPASRARIPTAPSLLLMGHTDVVPVNPDGWSRDPFAGDIVDGFVWGRGAVDMLNITASQAVAFKRLAESGFKPKGTLIYLAVADEEALGTWGAKWLVEHERDAVYADYVLTESGGYQMPTADGRPSCPCSPPRRARSGRSSTSTGRRVTGRSRSAPTTRSSPRPRSCGGSTSTGPQTQHQRGLAPVRRGACDYPPEIARRVPRSRRAAGRARASCRSACRGSCTRARTRRSRRRSCTGARRRTSSPTTSSSRSTSARCPARRARRCARCSTRRSATSPTAVEIESNDDPSTESPIDTPLWDSLERVTSKLVEGTRRSCRS